MDLLLQIFIPHGGGGPRCRLQIDKVADGCYRATAGSLSEVHELCRTPDLEQLLRHAHRLSVSRSFGDVLATLQRLSEMDGRPGSVNRTVSEPRPTGARGHNRDPSGAAAGAVGWRFRPVKLRPASRLAQWL